MIEQTSDEKQTRQPKITKQCLMDPFNNVAEQHRTKRIQKTTKIHSKITEQTYRYESPQRCYFVDQNGRRKNITFVVSEREIEINKNKKFSDVLRSVIEKLSHTVESIKVDNEIRNPTEIIALFGQKEISPLIYFQGKPNQNEQTPQTDSPCSLRNFQEL